MKSTIWLAAMVSCVCGQLAVLVLEWWNERPNAARIDHFQEGTLETMAFSEKNRAGYGEAMY